MSKEIDEMEVINLDAEDDYKHIEKKPDDDFDMKTFIKYGLITVAVVSLISIFVVQKFGVSGISMENTLHDGNEVLVDKISYRFRNPNRFEIIAFRPHRYDGDENIFFKRIIGLPNETVRIDENGLIYINDEPLYIEKTLGFAKDEEFLLINSAGEDNLGSAKDGLTLGDNEYFVLGDNRNFSNDSRNGKILAVERSEIIGRVWLRYKGGFTVFPSEYSEQ